MFSSVIVGSCPVAYLRLIHMRLSFPAEQLLLPRSAGGYTLFGRQMAGYIYIYLLATVNVALKKTAVRKCPAVVGLLEDIILQKSIHGIP